MKKLIFISLLVSACLLLKATDKVVNAPFVEGKGLRGWLIDSISITDKATKVYGHFGLGKGSYASEDLDYYIEDPATGKKYKQTDLQGDLPLAPKKIEGRKEHITFVMIFPPIPAETKVVNIKKEDSEDQRIAWFGVWLCPKTTVFTEKLAQLSPIEGNWFATDGSGDWKAGFYEKKIYWDNQFWDYTVLKSDKKTATLELSNGDNKRTLNIQKRAEDKLLIQENKQKLLLKRMPVYAKEDIAPFQTKWNNTDSITVSGYYQVADPVFSQKAVLRTNDLFLNNISYPLNISKDGLFSITIPLAKTSQLVFSNELEQSRHSQQSFMAEPGDHVILTYRNEDEANVVFGGDNQRVNNEFQTFSSQNPYFVNKKRLTKNLYNKPEEFAKWRNDLEEQLEKAYIDWQAKHKENKKLDQIVSDAERYGYWSDMIQASFMPKCKINADSILAMIKSMDVYNNKSTPFSEDYLSFLQTIDRLSSSTRRITESTMCQYLIKNAKLSEADRTLLENLSSLENQIQTSEDVKKYRAFTSANKTKIDSIFFINQVLLQEQKLNVEKAANEKFGIPKGFASSYIQATPFAKYLVRNESYLEPDVFKSATDGCKDSLILDYLISKNTKIEQEILSWQTKVLPEDIHLHQIADTTNVAKAIFDQFKGKIIYLDFWATWCGGCKVEMPYSRKQHALLKDKNIAFVYVTGESSPELTWKRMISEIPGDHIRLTKEQWTSICNQYKVTGIPRFMLIDQSGNVVNENAPQPSSGDMLQKAVNKLL